jgi:hypothetical protein
VRLGTTGGFVPLVAAAIALAACGSPSPSGSAAATSSAGGTTRPTDAAVPSALPPSSASPTPAASGLRGGMVVDASLLDHLPVDVDGVALVADAESAAAIAAAPDLGSDLASIAVAVYAADDDYAVVTVSGLRPGTFSDQWFRDWRDSFDVGVCAQAGGVDPGRSEMSLGDRMVFRSTCDGGVVMYHTYLAATDVLVSIQGAGERDLGRQVMAGLEE